MTWRRSGADSVQEVDSRGDRRGDGEGVALRDLASLVELSADMGAWENWYTTSVEGDTRKPKLSRGTEMVLCPLLERVP